MLLDFSMMQLKQSTDRESSEVSLGKSRKSAPSLAFPDTAVDVMLPYVFSLQNFKHIGFSCDFRHLKAKTTSRHSKELQNSIFHFEHTSHGAKI